MFLGVFCSLGGLVWTNGLIRHIYSCNANIIRFLTINVIWRMVQFVSPTTGLLLDLLRTSDERFAYVMMYAIQFF